jgi:aminopeptidase N
LTIFKVDISKKSKPVSTVINHPNEIKQNFGAITYQKGSCIIGMMHKFLGEKIFQKGVSSYLKKYSYANAEQDDLWDSLTVAAQEKESLRKLPLKKIMDSWTLQAGYPIIDFKRDYQKNSATITQTRFFSNVQKTETSARSCWWIPLTYTDSVKKNFYSYGVRTFF